MEERIWVIRVQENLSLRHVATRLHVPGIIFFGWRLPRRIETIIRDWIHVVARRAVASI
jgi:hypothetical protein